MSKNFNCISIIGNLNHPKSLLIYKMLYSLLNKKKYNIIIEKKIAYKLNFKKIKTGNLNYIGKNSDLAIVIGGDGNMLSTARILSSHNIKIIGINLGNLGFLTDLNPYKIEQQISAILSGKYLFENRFLLEVKIFKKCNTPIYGTAINEIILHADKIANMIDFEVYIDENFAFSQRSNGLIISTPTGSTAYSLSAGGPILQSSLGAIVLISLFPHTLSFRPLVIKSSSTIRLCNLYKNDNIKITCDSQIAFSIEKDDNILIKKSKNKVNLIHPLNYNYFHTLISKLGWSKKLF